MSAIFLSHSSADNVAAQTVKEKLEACGHEVFLDIDPETGIPAGSTWEKVLSGRIQVCQAVVPLLSPDWIGSKWCLAELFHARAVGKAIVPVTIRAHADAPWLAHLQQIDLTRDPSDGLARLLHALEDVHPLVPGRPPYPGLAAYTEDDAGVFFGREPEVAAGLEVLESLRRRGRHAPRLLIVLGASGSGKSSLVRAGVVPRLRRRKSEWLVLPVVRPRANPIDELATSLAAAHVAVGRACERSALAKQLEDGAKNETTSILLESVRDLRIAARALGATVLLVFDQMEELFTRADQGTHGEACLALLRRALLDADDELVVVGTIRSDFLATFQQHAFLGEDDSKRTLTYEKLTVDPLPMSRLDDVIRRPAERLGVTTAPALIARLTEDVQATIVWATEKPSGVQHRRQAADALPLLALALRRLWTVEEQHPDKCLDLRDYEDAGELKGTIEHAVASALTLTDETKAVLRAAMIPAMVQVTADGARVRRRARFDSTPPESRPLLERLVTVARVLVMDHDQDGHATIEVAHEAVFRLWSDFAKWLDEDEYKLRVLEEVRRAATDWSPHERSDLLVHRDGRLSEARGVLEGWAKSGAGGIRESVVQRYLDACLREQSARDEAARDERERRLRDARTIWRRTAIGFGVAALAIALIVVVLFLSGSLVRIRATTRDTQRWALAKIWAAEDPTIAGLILNEIRDPENLPANDLGVVSVDVLGNPAWWTELRHEGPVSWVDVSGEGTAIVTASADKTARIWNANGTGSPLTLRHAGEVLRAIFSPDGNFVVTSALDNSVSLWRRKEGAAAARLDHRNSFALALTFSRDGRRLLTGAFDGTIRVWSTSEPYERLLEHATAAPVTVVAFNADRSRWLAGSSNTLWLGRSDGPDAQPPVACDFTEEIAAAGFDARDQWVEVVTRNGSVYRFAPDAARQGTRCTAADAASLSTERIAAAALSRSSDRAVTLQRNGVLTVWDGLSRSIPRSAGLSEAGYVAFSPTGDTFATAHENGTVQLWQFARPERSLTLSRHGRTVRHVAFSENGKVVATASDDNTARVWRVGDDSNNGVTVIRHDRNVSDVSFTADGQRVLSASTRGDVQFTSLNGETRAEWRFSHSQAGATEAAASPRGDWVLSVARNGKARLWSADVPRAQRRRVTLNDPQDPGNVVRHARFSTDGRRVVTASDDGTARIWDVDRLDAEPVRLLGHERNKPLTDATFDASAKRVATASADGTARLWDATTGAEFRVFPHGQGSVVTDVAFSPGGERIVTAATDSMARLWPVDGSPPVVLRHSKPVRIVAFSPDGKRVLSACEDGIVRVWPIDGSTAAIQLTGHDQQEMIVAAEFSRDGRRVLSASQDGTARVWSADGAGDPIVLRHPAGLTRAAFNPAGNMVITGSIDSRARIWTLSPARLLEIIRSRTHSCLTADFRVRHFLEGQREADEVFKTCESQRQARGQS